MCVPFLGEIRMVGFNFAPRDWAFCDGQLVPIGQNSALFALLGTTYGGDGRTTFGLPDLRGRVPMHAGRGPGLSQRQAGERPGMETASLGVPQIPAHNHIIQTSAPSARVDVTNNFVTVSAPDSKAIVGSDFIKVSAPAATVDIGEDFVTSKMNATTDKAAEVEPGATKLLANTVRNPIYSGSNAAMDSEIKGISTAVDPSALIVTNAAPEVTMDESKLYVAVDAPTVTVDPSKIAVNVSTPSAEVLDTGMGEPHMNVQPSLVVNFIIALDGIFPPRH